MVCLQVNEFLKANLVPEMSVEEIAMGFVRVANEAMCRPIRNLTQGKGYGEKYFKSETKFLYAVFNTARALIPNVFKFWMV